MKGGVLFFDLDRCPWRFLRLCVHPTHPTPTRTRARTYATTGCNAFLQTASSVPALSSTVSTVGRLGAELMVKQVGDMTRGSSGASEVEKGYLEAPYTQARASSFFFFVFFFVL